MKKILAILFIIISLSAFAQKINYVTPNIGELGQTMDITVIGTGTHFKQLSKPGVIIENYWANRRSYITVNSISAISDLIIKVNITIDISCVLGFYSVWVDDSSTVFGTYKDSAFQVYAPLLKNITPNIATHGETLNVSIKGVNTHFKNGNNLAVSFLRRTMPMQINSVTAITNDSLIANITLNKPNDTGFYDLTVYDPMSGNLFIQKAFEVLPLIPKLLKAIPKNINSAQPLNVKIYGTNTHFTLGTTSVGYYYKDSLSTNIHINSFSAQDDSTLNCFVTFDSSAINGNYDIRVDNIFDGTIILQNALSITTGISELQNFESSICIFPNPAYDVLNISFAQQILPINISIIDMNGKILNGVNINKNKTLIDVRDFKNGIYFIQFSGKEFNTSRKIIINK